MKVRELIEELQCLDQEAEVLIAEQPNWPFEYSIDGVVTREMAMMYSDEDEQLSPNTSMSDVFLLEGTQLRYASKRLWDAV